MNQLIQRKFLWALSFLLAFTRLNSAYAVASHLAPQGVTLQGTILNAQGLPEESSNVVFTVEVHSPDPESCLLYRETHTLNMSASAGNFSFILGQGVRSGTSFEDTSSVSRAFDNNGTVMTALKCSVGTSYTPSSGQIRTVILSFNDGSGLHTVAQPLNVEATPYALNADRLQGFTPSDLLNLGTTTNLTQANVENIFSVTNYPRLNTLLSVQPSQYVTLGSNGSLGVPAASSDPASPVAGQIWYNSISNVLKFYNGTAVQVLGTDTVNGNAITAGTISGTTAISTTGNLQTTGSLSASKAYLYDHSGAGPGYVGLQVPANIVGTGGSSYLLTLPNSPGTSGQVLSTDGTGVLSWVSRTSGSVTSLTGSAPVTITGTAQAPIVNVSAATTAASGVVTLAASGGTTASTVVQATDARLSDSRNPSGSASGDLTGTYPGPTVAQIRGVAVSATAPTTSGQVLRYNGTSWTPNFISMFDLRSVITGSQAFGGSGCLPNQTLTWTVATDNLNCTNIAITDSQITYSNQTANLVFAGPTTGSAAPAFRSLVASDLPSGGYDTSYFKKGGNSFGSAAALGTGDSNSLTLQTNATTRLTILSTGGIGVGTGSPTAVLHLKAGTATAGTAPLKLTSGTNMTTAEAGAIEFDGTNLFYSDSTPTRRTLATTSNTQTFSGAITMSAAGTGLAVTNNQTVGGTLSVTGATTLSGGATIAANQGLTMSSGTGKFAQTYSGTGPASAITGTSSSSGDLLDLVTTTTAAVTGDKALSLAVSGANATATVTRYGVYSNVTATGTTSTNVAGYFSASGATANYGLLVANGNVGLGTTTPTAVLHLKAGTATAGTAPLKLTSGTNMTTAEAGAIEFDGTNLFYSDSTPTRRTLATTSNTQTFSGAITMSAAGTGLAVTNNQTVGGTLSVTGHVISAGASATVGSCGTTPTITGNDTRGTVTVGTGTVTSCVVTFNSSFGSAPYCVTTWSGSASAIGMGVTSTTAALTINFSANAAGLKVNYYCIQ